MNQKGKAKRRQKGARLTTKQLADRWKCSVQWIRECHKKGMPRLAPGWWNPIACDDWRAANDKGSDTTLAEAQRRKTAAEAELKELQLARETGETMNVSEHERELAAVFRAMGVKLDEAPLRHGPRLVGLTDVAIAVQRLAEVVAAVRAELRSIAE